MIEGLIVGGLFGALIAVVSDRLAHKTWFWVADLSEQ